VQKILPPPEFDLRTIKHVETPFSPVEICIDVSEERTASGFRMEERRGKFQNSLSFIAVNITPKATIAQSA